MTKVNDLVIRIVGRPRVDTRYQSVGDGWVTSGSYTRSVRSNPFEFSDLKGWNSGFRILPLL